MTKQHRIQRTEYTVSWPVQGMACFRSPDSKLVLSDVYWQWILDALSGVSDTKQVRHFVSAALDGFGDPSRLVETIPVALELLESLRGVEPSRAPSFEYLVPSAGCQVPSARQVLAELERVVSEALWVGSVEMEIS